MYQIMFVVDEEVFIDQEVFISDSDYEDVEAKEELQKKPKKKKESKEDENYIQSKTKHSHKEKGHDREAITEQMKKIDLNDNFTKSDSESSVKLESSNYFDNASEHLIGDDPDKVLLNDDNVLRRSIASNERDFQRKLKSGQSLTSRETLDSENSNPDVRIVSGWKTSKGTGYLNHHIKYVLMGLIFENKYIFQIKNYKYFRE